ncbi:MAG TPA: SGNH/GDSL hydrolase family protein [Verrucomicrobiae bacterium]|jgi:lysophospholipase L1-like esterase|nr:SGNH/GDSL hydrolase family protein [Verrucomicrobiae bacterium]
MHFRYLQITGTALCGLLMIHGSAVGQGTAFTYQGQLNDGGNSANGTYDMVFSLFAANVDGNLVAGPLTNLATTVTNGQFTASLDFGGVFGASNCWLDICVRTNGNDTFTELTPRQLLTPAPYAIFANTSGNLSGSLPTTQLTGLLQSSQFSGTYTNEVSFVNGSNAFAGAFTGSLTTTNPTVYGTASVYPDVANITIYTNENPYGTNCAAANAYDLTNGLFSFFRSKPYLYQPNQVSGTAPAFGTATLGFTFGIYGQEFVIEEEGYGQTLFVNLDGVSQPITTSLTNDGSYYYIKYTFASWAPRTIRVNQAGGSVTAVYYPATSGWIRGASYAYKRMIVLGDSYTDGANGIGTCQTFPSVLMNYFLNLDVWPSGSGGTGYIANNSGISENFQGRVQSDVITNNPDIVMVAGGINDLGYPSNQLYSAASQLYSTLKQSLPAATILVVGPWWPRSIPIDTNMMAGASAIQAAAANAGLAFIQPAGNNPNPWITGYYSVPGSGNAVNFISSDGTHPTVAGHAFLAANLAPFVASNCPGLMLNTSMK